MNKTTTEHLDSTVTQQIDQWCKKFPKDQKRSAIIMSLRYIQDHYGWLSDKHLNLLAEYLDLPPIQIYEAASFYSMYHRKPVGKYVIGVCNSISCMLRDSESVIKHFEKSLGISLGETTQDGLFTLEEVECVASCTKAPALLVNGTEYHEDVTAQSADQLIEKLKQEATHAA